MVTHEQMVSLHISGATLYVTPEQARIIRRGIGDTLILDKNREYEITFGYEDVVLLKAGAELLRAPKATHLTARLGALLGLWGTCRYCGVGQECNCVKTETREQNLPPLKAIVEVTKATDSTNEHVGAYGHVIGYDYVSQCGQTPGDPMIVVSFSGGGQGRFWKEELVELVRKE